MGKPEPVRAINATGVSAIQLRFREVQTWLQAGVINGETLIERLLTGLLAGGHLLVEGAPGLAKTRAVKRLAQALNAPFARIQCTPDLMPADLTGTSVWRADRNLFEFVAGPVFHALVLVDEINRAPPKVQSALLEAMGERQVTVAGTTHSLPQPFMVVGTQNPIEHEGTFPLPEAQLDRFMMHVEVKLPDAATERLILDLVEQEAIMVLLSSLAREAKVAVLITDSDAEALLRASPLLYLAGGKLVNPEPASDRGKVYAFPQAGSRRAAADA